MFEPGFPIKGFPVNLQMCIRDRVYRGDGIAAGLFYEAKVAEAVSLVVEEQKKILSRKEKRLRCV